MKNKCLRCNSELVTIENETSSIITRFCKECGLIENAFTKPAIEELLKVAVKVGDKKE